jgi:hypothetical protein
MGGTPCRDSGVAPDALVPGVSPRWEGLGMAEPSRSDLVEHLLNFVRMTPSFVSHREELSWLNNILQEMRSATLRHALQVGYDTSYGELIPFHLPFAHILPAMLDQSSLESERPLATNVQDGVEFQYDGGLAPCRDQDVWLCLTHYEEAIKVHRPVGNTRGLAKVLVENETNLPPTVVRVGTLVDSQPLYYSDIAFSPVLPCARS